MIVALDATPLSAPTGGINRYTAELSRALAREFPGDEYHLLSDQPYPAPAALPPNLTAHPADTSLLGRRWWSTGLSAALRRLNAQVFHGTDFAVPYLPLRPAVMMLHDLSPWRDTGWHAAAGRVRRRTPLLLRLGLATMIVTPSERVRREAIERFRLTPERIVAVPLAAAEHFRPSDPARRAPYFLCVATLEPRKNIPFLIDAWRELRMRHRVDLVLAGRRREDFPAFEREEGLEWLGAAPDAALRGLYSGAVAAVYPSLYEGFGLPVLEAMSCGAAVIASNDEAVAEVAGGVALTLDPTDRRAWVEAMAAMAENTDLREDFRRRSLARSHDFSWAATARATREVYREAVKRFA